MLDRANEQYKHLLPLVDPSSFVIEIPMFENDRTGATLASDAYSAKSATEWSRNFARPNIIGASETAKVYYKFGASAGTAQTNAGQSLGYYRGYNGSTFGTWSKFYNVRSADKNTQGGATVSWGNVAAQAQFRAKCATSTLCGGTFTANGQ